MRNYPKALKRKLLDTICQMREDLSAYATDPKRDFTRSRKLPFETLCRTILSMSGQSLNVELQRQFHYDPTAATASAFVQRRGKLLPAAFEEKNRPIRRWNGYTLLAVDGSHVQIPSNIHDKATHFISTKEGRGYNLLHLNALYDLENQLYLDAVIQNGREEHESRALVELVDRSRLKEPVIMIADRGYEAYNNIAHIEQKNWNYLIRAKEKRGILSGVQTPHQPYPPGASEIPLDSQQGSFRLYQKRKRCVVSHLLPRGQICGQRGPVRDCDHQPSPRPLPPSAAPCALPQTLGNRDVFPGLEVHPGIDALSC